MCTNATMSPGWTPLHRALYNGRIGVALMLIESGAKLDARAHLKQAGQLTPGKADRDGNTPLDLVSLPLRKNLHATDESARADNIGNVFTFGQFQQQLGYGIFGRTRAKFAKTCGCFEGNCYRSCGSEVYHICDNC